MAAGARRRRSRSGIAALEFGLLAPIFMMALAGMVDIGNAITVHFILNASVNAASSFALSNASAVGTASEQTLASNLATLAATNVSTQTTGDLSWATSTTSTVSVNNGSTATVTSGTASTGGTTSSSCYCPTGTASSITWGSPTTCGNTCAGGSTAGKFVVITATHSYTPIFPVYAFVSGAMSTAALVRVQ